MALNVSTIKRNKKRIRLKKLDNIKLDVGCGDDKHNSKIHGLKGYIGIDIKDYGQELVWDIEEGIPLPDNSCTHIFCSHVVEHVVDLIGLLNEFWRILKPNGELKIICPHKNHESAYSLFHIRRLDENTFKGICINESYLDNWEDDYEIRPFELKELIVNERKDIHFLAKPYKK